MKRELIESCPDFPGHLAEEDLQDDLDQPDHIDQGYPSLEDLVYEKEDVAKEEQVSNNSLPKLYLRPRGCNASL